MWPLFCWRFCILGKSGLCLSNRICMFFVLWLFHRIFFFFVIRSFNLVYASAVLIVSFLQSLNKVSISPSSSRLNFLTIHSYLSSWNVEIFLAGLLGNRLWSYTLIPSSMLHGKECYLCFIAMISFFSFQLSQDYASTRWSMPQLMHLWGSSYSLVLGSGS